MSLRKEQIRVLEKSRDLTWEYREGTTVAANAGDVILGIGAEFLLLGIATGVASINDDVGNIMVVFMIGLLLLWLMYHVAITNAIPNLFKLAQG